MFVSKNDLKQKVAFFEKSAEKNSVIKEKLETEIAKLDKEKKELSNKLKKANKIIREQTEADILLNAFKAVGIIKEDKPEKTDFGARHNNLFAQLQQAQRQHVYGGLPWYDVYGNAFGV